MKVPIKIICTKKLYFTIISVFIFFRLLGSFKVNFFKERMNYVVNMNQKFGEKENNILGFLR